MTTADKPATSAPPPTIEIVPPGGWMWLDFAELAAHRSLLFHLVKRDIRALFASTVLGVTWIVLQPLATVVVMTVFLGMLVRVPTGNIPYALVVLTGLVPWSYFGSTVTRSCHSMLANSPLLSKVYFPRLIIPLVPVFVALMDLLVLLVVLLVLATALGYGPNVRWLGLPLPLLLTLLISTGMSLWLSSLNVVYRDVGNLVPVILQVGAYATPIYYPTSLVPANWQWFYNLNPMVGIVELMRWAMLGTDFPQRSLIATLVAAAILPIWGALVFHRMEDKVTDTL